MGSVKALFKRKQITKDALKSIDLEIKQGEIVGLIGANGAGKTTLVKILAGIVHPTSGDATVLGLSLGKEITNTENKCLLLWDKKHKYGGIFRPLIVSSS